MDQRLSIQYWQLKLQSMPWLLPVWAKAPLVAAAVMTLVLAQLAAQLSWQFLSPLTIELASRTGRSAQAIQSPQINLADVVNTHLFGKLATTASEGPINAPVTRLKLGLHGVFASNDARLAMAIISDAGGKQKSYHIGDAVPGGARLHAIYPDRVILDRLGKLETLKLPREVASFNSAAISAPGFNAELPTASSRVFKIQASEKVKRLRETLIRSPQAIWKDVRIEPVLEGGRIQGYHFRHKDKSLMRSLGLRPDDVITGINGMSLTDPSVLYGIMSQITTMDNVSLTILRKGQTETIDIIM